MRTAAVAGLWAFGLALTCAPSFAQAGGLPLYVVERGSGELSVIDEDKTIHTLTSGLQDPLDVERLPDGRLIVSERVAFTPSAGYLTIIDPNTGAILESVHHGFNASDIFIDDDGITYVSTVFQGIWKKGPSDADWVQCSAIPGDATDIVRVGEYLYALDSGTTNNFIGTLYRIDPSNPDPATNFTQVYTGFAYLIGMAKHNGDLFVAEFNGNRVRRVTGFAPGQTVSVTTFASGLPQASSFAPDDDGNLYLSHQKTPGSISIIAPDGTITPYITDSSQLSSPRGMARRITGIRPPIADGGPDQTVTEGTSVTLDGSGSSDPRGEPLTWTWTQVGGSPVNLDVNDPVHPGFTAPPVASGGETLSFELIVHNGIADSAPDVVNVSVKDANHPPIAEAGDDFQVSEGGRISIDGRHSYDPDGDALTFQWSVTGPCVIDDPAAPVLSADAPLLVSGEQAACDFALTVGDGEATAADTVRVTVVNVNQPPVARAGADQTIGEGGQVSLSGAGSSDPDGDPLTFTWTQVGGTPVVLSDPHAPSPVFSAPPVGPGGDLLTFVLTVDDGFGGVSTDVIDVSVLDRDDPPVCTLARASQTSLWPPDHKMVPINILGVTDPNNDRVTIQVTRVTQDEPLNGTGDGDTGPDAALQDGGVMLRAERSGNLDGRVYRIEFTALDPSLEGCSGVVTVCVPHSVKSVCVDSGQGYNSLTK